MGFLKTITDATLLRRTKYHAMYKGKEIWGCGECGNNHEFPGLLPFAPTHKCIIVPVEGEGMLTILDPFNIPEQCPLKIDPILPEGNEKK